MKPKVLSGTIPLMAAVMLVLGTFMMASATSLSNLLVGNAYWVRAGNNELLDHGHQYPKWAIDSPRSSLGANLICADLTNNAGNFTSCRHGAELPVEHTNNKCEIPEPGTLLLLGLGLIGMASYRRFQIKRRGS